MAPSVRRKLRRALARAPEPLDVSTVRVLLKQARVQAYRLSTLIVEIDKLLDAMPGLPPAQSKGD